MQNTILFGILVLAMFACGYILQRPILKGMEPSEERIVWCILAALAIVIFVGPGVLPPLAAAWLIPVGLIATVAGVLGPIVLKTLIKPR